MHQALTGKATPFRRTPKVNDRTAVPRLYVLAPCIGVACLCAGFAFDASSGLWLNALAAGVNAAFLGYAIRTFIGWRHLREDLFGWPALEGEASEGEPGSRKERIDRRARRAAAVGTCTDRAPWD